MREVINYSHNFVTNEKAEEKYIKEDWYENKVVVELKDSEGNIVQKSEGENVVCTGNINEIIFLNNYGVHCDTQQGGAYSTAMLVSSRGMWLTDYNGEEKADQFIVKGNVLAMAYRNSSTVSPTPTLGYMNNSETTKIGKNEYKMVFDFPENTANGTFQSIWLTNNYDTNDQRAINSLDLVHFSNSSTLCFNSHSSYNNGRNPMYYKGDLYSIANLTLYKTALDYWINGTSHPSDVETTIGIGKLTHSYGTIFHISDSGKLYAIVGENNTYSKVRLTVLDLEDLETPMVHTTSNSIKRVISTNYKDDKIYCLCERADGIPSILIMRVEELEAILNEGGDLDIPYEFLIPVSEFVEKDSTYSGSGVCTYSNIYYGTSFIVEDTLFLTGRSITVDGSQRDIEINLTTGATKVSTGFKSFYSNGLGVAGFNNSVSSTLPTFNAYIAKVIDNKIAIMCPTHGSTSTTMYYNIGILKPIFSHYKLPAPITKDSSQSLKIQYTIKMNLPETLTTFKNKVY